jgi:aspartate-semialdehyde dehydrogenase
MGIRVAIMGATGAVGQEFLTLLEERAFPVSELRLLASARSAGKTMRFGGDSVPVHELKHDSFEGIDLVLASAGGSISKEFAPSAVKAGAVVVDNTSYFRMHEDVPLVIPEINPEAMENHKGVIANPNCSTIIMCLPLWPLHKAASRGISPAAACTRASAASTSSIA